MTSASGDWGNLKPLLMSTLSLRCLSAYDTLLYTLTCCTSAACFIVSHPPYRPNSPFLPKLQNHFMLLLTSMLPWRLILPFLGTLYLRTAVPLCSILSSFAPHFLLHPYLLSSLTQSQHSCPEPQPHQVKFDCLLINDWYQSSDQPTLHLNRVQIPIQIPPTA